MPSEAKMTEIPREGEVTMGDSAKPVTKQEIVEKLERGETNFDNRDLRDLNLTGLNLRGATFRGSDVRGLRVDFGETPTDLTDLRETDWTDAIFADQFGVQFYAANLEGSLFVSSTDQLLNLCMVDVAHATLREATFRGCYFGVESGYGFVGRHTNFSDVRIEESDIMQFDFRNSIVDGIKIVDCQIEGILIRPDQLATILRGLTFTDPEKTAVVKTLKQAARTKNIEGIAEATQKLGISFGEFDISVLGK